jgi:hypothetical protein
VLINNCHNENDKELMKNSFLKIEDIYNSHINDSSIFLSIEKHYKNPDNVNLI